jgi:hypothetical protein
LRKRQSSRNRQSKGVWNLRWELYTFPWLGCQYFKADSFNAILRKAQSLLVRGIQTAGEETKQITDGQSVWTASLLITLLQWINYNLFSYGFSLYTQIFLYHNNVELKDSIEN